MRNMIAFAALATLLLCAPAFSNETTIEVPQGSGVFPTVGQLNCLEEAGSGRFCAATYECADESGDLWGDLANHDGRRAIGVESPVARERGCTITVDGKAAVRWFVGFSPDGRDGALVGVTANHDAEPPTMRRVAQGSGGSGSFLSWYVERYEIGDIVAEVREQTCGHIKEGTPELDGCLEHTLPLDLGRVVSYITWENTPFTQCAAEYLNDANAMHPNKSGPLEALTTRGLDGSGCSVPGPRNKGIISNPLCRLVATIAARPDPHTLAVNPQTPLPDRYIRCRMLLEEQWEREGFGELL